MAGISFKIKSSQDNSIVKKPVDADKEIVLSLEDKKIQSSRPDEAKKNYVIPLIKKNKWKTNENADNDIKQTKSEEELRLEKLAAKEILEECKNEISEIDKRNSASETQVIPLLLQNKPPEGFETDEKLDVSLRPDESSLEDYEQMPINEFGKALLKGMGWKVGEGIGLNKKIVEPKEVAFRPKLVGLGFDLSKLKPNTAKKEDPDLKLVKGAYIYIEEGAHKGTYGQVESFDEENGSVIIKLALNNQNIEISELFVRVVSYTEFKKGKKVLNNSTYEEYRKKDAKDQKRKVENPFESYKYENSKQNGNDYGKMNKKHFRDRSPIRTLWVQPQLKVRLIDENYKKGKYFKTKLIIEDVVSKDMCVCKTEDGRILDDISAEMLETVIPRSESSYVMVVHGKYKGQIGNIIKRDKSSCIATVNLLSSQAVHEFDYDLICEYVGEPIY